MSSGMPKSTNIPFKYKSMSCVLKKDIARQRERERARENVCELFDRLIVLFLSNESIIQTFTTFQFRFNHKTTSVKHYTLFWATPLWPVRAKNKCIPYAVLLFISIEIDFILPVSLFCDMAFIDAEIIVFAQMIINAIDSPAIQIYASMTRLSESLFIYTV